MFDKVNRHFSRRGKDLSDIATSSATMDGMHDFDSYRYTQKVEKNIDEESFDSAVIDTMIPQQREDIISYKDSDVDYSTPTPVKKAEPDIISSVNDDDDFQEI